MINRILRRIGHAVRPIVDPDDVAGRRAKDDAAVRRALDELGRMVEQLAARVERVERVDRRQSERLQETASGLDWSVRRQMAFTDRLLHAAHVDKGHEFLRERAMRRLRTVSRSQGPVVVGPWTGEVGFELLYWVPFVRWAVERFSIDPARLTIVSRGGTASWYGLPGARYVDLFEHRSPAEFVEHGATANRKQRTLRRFDRRLIRDVSAGLGGRGGLIHPALLYAIFTPYWKRVTSARWIAEFLRPARIVAPSVPGLNLPRDYTAVRFYYSDSFPETPDNRALVESVIRGLSAERDVVVLGSGVRVDDHRDASVIGASPRVHRVDHLLRPENNLAVQTAVIAGASAFIGTYGGFSYLAPLCGVDAVAVYSTRHFFAHHLEFAQRMCADVQGGSLTVIDTATRDLLAPLTTSARLT